MNKKVVNLANNRKYLLVIGIIIVIVGLFGGGILSFLTSIDEANDLDTVTKKNVFSKVEVLEVSDYFATLTTDRGMQRYYFLFNDDNIYVAKLDPETFKRLENNYLCYIEESDATPDAVTILGISEEIPDEIKNFAIDYLQEYENLDVNASNFNTTVYPYLINTYVTKTNMIMDIVTIFSIITVIGLVLVVMYVNYQGKTKKNIKKFNNSLKQIEAELNEEGTIHNEVCKVYLTNNYIISYSSGISIIELKNIIWVYPYEYRQKGDVVKRSICLVTNDLEKNLIASITKINKEKNHAYDDLYQKILEKTPASIHGYSKANKAKAESMANKKGIK